ncbi:hypothetical protein LPB138_00940 [Urechidicola croceus]|uniref:Uncharacterized protein n=1 Tax=Urechidicola croceus TaxID=1850246 RepID=A0A1D8P424_9FLAO|nr:hypothetical protein LPB138_00940 [Urechidicola croceus]
MRKTVKNRQTQIEILAGDGNLTELKKIFDSGYSQLELDVALENAIAYSRIKTADYLLELGADFSNYDYQGIYYAAHNNELSGMKYAIAKGVDINVNNGMLLNTAIVTFTNTKDIEMIKWLMENGADRNHLTESSIDLIERYGTDELKSIIDTPTKKTVKIIDSWNITGFGIIAELENIHDGITKGTKLKSQETGLTWIVESRIVETLAIDSLKRFPNETETPMHLNFKSVSKLENAKETIIKKNRNRVFKYRLKPSKQNEKPKNGEILLIE